MQDCDRLVHVRIQELLEMNAQSVFGIGESPSHYEIIAYLTPCIQIFSPVHNVLDEAIVPYEVVLLQIDFAFVQNPLGVRIA